MTTPAMTFYFDPLLGELPIYAGPITRREEGFDLMYVRPSGAPDHIVYRVMARPGVAYSDAEEALTEFLALRPGDSYREFMLAVPPSAEMVGADVPAVRADPSYASLRLVLDAALAQAKDGKGKDRHATEADFDHQPSMRRARICGLGGPIQQVLKKAEECLGMAARGEHAAAKAELLGAINYAAMAYLLIDEKVG